VGRSYDDVIKTVTPVKVCGGGATRRTGAALLTAPPARPAAPLLCARR